MSVSSIRHVNSPMTVAVPSTVLFLNVCVCVWISVCVCVNKQVYQVVYTCYKETLPYLNSSVKHLIKFSRNKKVHIMNENWVRWQALLQRSSSLH